MTAQVLLTAARYYHEKQDWYLRLMLLMPDHLHALMAPAPDTTLGAMVGKWKSYVAKAAGINWQKDFFDHRLRSDESQEEKAAYIRANPIRAGLIAAGETWLFQIQH